MVNRFTFLGFVCALSVFGLALLVVALADSSGNPLAIDAEATTPPSPIAAAPVAPAETATPEPTVAPTETATPTPTAPQTPTPTPDAEGKATPLDRAAKAAGCTVSHPPNEGADHVTQPTTAADYDSNPPTSGPHAPNWPPDGIYPPQETPRVEFTVHTLEHGRINVQYAQDTQQSTITALEQFVKDSDDGYHMLLFHNQTDMPFAVAATAWDHLIGCKEFNAKTVAALAAFREAYIDKGPETVP